MNAGSAIETYTNLEDDVINYTSDTELGMFNVNFLHLTLNYSPMMLIIVIQYTNKTNTYQLCEYIQ